MLDQSSTMHLQILAKFLLMCSHTNSVCVMSNYRAMVGMLLELECQTDNLSDLTCQVELIQSSVKVFMCSCVHYRLSCFSVSHIMKLFVLFQKYIKKTNKNNEFLVISFCYRTLFYHK